MSCPSPGAVPPNLSKLSVILIKGLFVLPIGPGFQTMQDALAETVPLLQNAPEQEDSPCS